MARAKTVTKMAMTMRRIVKRREAQGSKRGSRIKSPNSD